MSTSRQRTLFIVLLALLSLGALAMLYFDTAPAGIGLTNDSAAYIAGARSILHGTGYSDAWLDSSLEPITHYPPLFSLVLAALGAVGIDPLRGARILSVLFFGVNTFLLGLLGWRMTRSQVAGLFLALIFMLSPDVVRTHIYAMSEPLFLFFSLLSFIFVDLFIESQRKHWIVLAGLVTGLGFLARYSALALLVTFIIVLFFLQKNWRERFQSIAFYLVGAIPPMAAWFIRNKLVADTITNRTFQYHPILISNIRLGLRNFTQFLTPIASLQALLYQSGLTTLILVALGAAILLWLAVRAYSNIFRPAAQAPQALTFSTALYVFGYLGAVLFSMNFFDASTKFHPRILAPLYVSLMVLAVTFCVWLWRLRRKVSQGLVIGLAILALIFSVYGTALYMPQLLDAGQGYASWQWHDSQVMATLKKLPPDIAIYTNSPPAVYLVTGRASRVLPTPVDPVDDQPRGDYQQNVDQMRADLLAGRAVLALFDTSNLEDALGTQNVDTFTSQLAELQKAQGDVLYGKP